MPTTIYSSGPAAIVVGRSAGYGTYGFGTAGFGPPTPANPSILGWCERSPQIEVSGAYTPLFNTLGGVELPYTYLYQGAEGRIYCTLTKWDDYVLYVLEHLYVLGDPVTYHSLAINMRGLYVAIVYPLWASTGLPATPHAWINFFPVCRVERIEKRDMGTMPAKVSIVFHAIRSHVIPTSRKMPAHSGLGSMNIGAVGGYGAADQTDMGGSGGVLSSVASVLSLFAMAAVP